MAFVPDIDDDVPLPVRASEVMPDLSVEEELEMRVNTMKLLSDLTGKPIEPTPEHQIEAYELAKKMAMDPKSRPEFARYPNEVMAYLAGMVAQSNCMLVDELSDLKLYVINKLVYEVEHAKDSRSRIAALSKLGEVDGVDAFKRRSEMTVQVKPIAEVEQELLQVLDNIEYSVLPNAPSEVEASEEETVSNEEVEGDSIEKESDSE
jgi:hypothetical protein